MALGLFARTSALGRLLATQVALDLAKGLSDLGNRSEGRLRVVRVAIPDAQEIPDFPERQFLDPMNLVCLKDMVQELTHLKCVATEAA